MIATSATNLHLTATAPSLRCSAQVSISGGPKNVPVSVVIDTTVIDAIGALITPVAIPAGDETQWYVPYVGPLPYSYGASPFTTTTQINSGAILGLKITVGQLSVDVGNTALDAAIDILLSLFKKTIEEDLSTALQQNINTLLVSIYDGTVRVG